MLRTNRDIRRLFLAQVVSYAGDWFTYVAFVGLVEDHSSSKVLISLVYVALALPNFLASPVAGAVADRFDRRTIIATVSILQAVFGCGLLLVHSRSTLWIGFVSLSFIAALGAFVAPAAQAGLPNLTRSADELRRAAVLFGSLWGAMLAVGAALGGAVAVLFGRTTAFIADIASFVIAAILVKAIITPMQRHEVTSRARIRPLADMAEALRVARRDRVILALTASKTTFAIGAGIVGLLAAMATDVLHGGDGSTGLLIAARGVGVGLGPAIAARLLGPSLAKMLVVAGSAGLMFGVSYLGLSVANSLALAAILVFVAHLGGGAQWTISTYALQRRTDDAVRGRIMAGDMAVAMLVSTTSNMVAGTAADAIGVRPTLAIFAGVGMIASTAYLLATRQMRARLRHEEDA